jgi:hypothetical protein
VLYIAVHSSKLGCPHLPDKEFRYHRTVIVTAAVHQILDPQLVPTLRRKSPEILNYWHWAGVSPYTSDFSFAGTCVFDKQSLSVVYCNPPLAWQAGHLANLRPVVLPSSLRIVLSIAFVYSTRPPVLVCSTVSLCPFTEIFLKTEILSF